MSTLQFSDIEREVMGKWKVHDGLDRNFMDVMKGESDGAKDDSNREI